MGDWDPIPDEPPLWAPQVRGLEGIRRAIDDGARRILAVGPTGIGKSRVMREIIRWGKSIVIYSNRKMLTQQLAAGLDAAGIGYGVRAAGHKPRLLERVQLSSIQTEAERVMRQQRWQLHEAEIALLDEAHAQGGDTGSWVIQRHVEKGGVVIGFTATPLGLDHQYETMVEFGSVSDAKACGALVDAITFAPDEPDYQKIRETDGVVTEPQIIKAMPPHRIFGRVLEHWRILNPEAKPTILFAPGVKESIWFAEQLTAAGVPAAHIDGNDVWINGQWFTNDEAARDLLREQAESGKVKIVCNRFVLREGIDWPFLYHGIFATIFGSLSSYLQSGGRILRQHYIDGRAQLDHVVIQDHGGNWWRHGSLNSDREWDLSYNQRIVAGLRQKRIRAKEELVPIHCPKCHACRLWGRQCPRCGLVCRTRSRLVVQTDGTLKEVRGDVYKPRRVASATALVERQWKSVYYRARASKKGMTFEQARALFAKENGWRWPPEGLPLMPTREIDWFQRVADVPPQLLTGGRILERQTEQAW